MSSRNIIWLVSFQTCALFFPLQISCFVEKYYLPDHGYLIFLTECKIPLFIISSPIRRNIMLNNLQNNENLQVEDLDCLYSL